MVLKAAIFDLNGTVLVDEQVWSEAFRKILLDFGVKEEKKMVHIGGIGVSENWPILIKKYGIETDKTPDELAHETTKVYFTNIKKAQIKSGFYELIDDLRSSGIITSLATSSTWHVTEKIFDEFEIEDSFDFVTTGDEVSEKKPSPQIFTAAADKMSVEPEYCIVFEDSAAGVDAANFAGMTAVGIYRNKAHKEELKEARLLIKDFTEVTPEKLSEL